MFQTEVVENQNMCFVFRNFFPDVVPFMR